MTILSIFAGIDKKGITRFVGDVERGLACGCFCDACGSPLVARQGDVREWYFAHEARQERPECITGALNLLRRLAIEHLLGRHTLELPVYREIFTAQQNFPRLSETAEWTSRPLKIEAWNLHPPKLSPAVRIVLDSGAAADLYVEVCSIPEMGRRGCLPDIGELLFWLPMPQTVDQLRTHELAQQHIKRTGQMHWIYQPDVLGLVANARARLDARVAVAQQVAEKAEEAERMRVQAAGRKWFDIQQELKRRERDSSIQPSPLAARQPASQAENTPWSSWRKLTSPLLFYVLKDGNGWLIIQHQDGRSILIPWPTPDAGWEAKVPSNVGFFEHELGGIVLANPTNTMIYLGGQSKMMRTVSGMSELALLSGLK
jgi:hypothetical protein